MTSAHMPPADDVRAAIRRVATRDGVALAEVSASFADLHGTTPDLTGLTAALGGLRFTGQVWRRGDLYFWHETGGPGPADLVGARRAQDTAVDIMVPASGPGRELAAVIAGCGPFNLFGRTATDDVQ